MTRRLAVLAAVVACMSDANAAPSCEYPAAVAAPPPPAPAPCRRPAAAVAHVVEDFVTAKFEPEHDGGSAEVSFACDGLDDSIAEVVVETGNGHGGTLSMWRARRNTDGRFGVVGIAYHGASMLRPARNPPFELATGTVDLPELERVRAGVDARIIERDPPRPDGSLDFRMSSSSNDFHVLIRLVDDAGRVVEGRFTGYEGTTDQAKYLGLQAAEPALAPITSLAAAHAPVTAEATALFADRFVATVARFDDDFEWWVKESFVELARDVGSSAVIPGLLTRLPPKPHARRHPDRSERDTRASAVAAIAAITGWDARRETASVDDAAARDLQVCHETVASDPARR